MNPFATVRRRRWLFCLLPVTIMGVLVWRGLSNAQADPVQHAVELRLSPWLPGSPPVRVALLADIHFGNRAMSASRLDRIIEGVNATSPDLILIAGDFINGHEMASANQQISELVALLAQLHAPLGVVAVLGNHDNWVAPSRIKAELASVGITVLENEAVRRGPLAVVGVGDRFSGHDNIAKAAEAARAIGGAPIVLTHSPDLASSLPEDFPLVLAGHTHCGQIYVRRLGAIVTRSPSQKFRPLYDQHYRCGMIRDPARVTVVTGGLGSGTIPIRLGTRPDWWMITLQADE